MLFLLFLVFSLFVAPLDPNELPTGDEHSMRTKTVICVQTHNGETEKYVPVAMAEQMAKLGRGFVGACHDDFECPEGFADCDGDHSCVTQLATNATNCGSCGNACGSEEACVESSCISIIGR